MLRTRSKFVETPFPIIGQELISKKYYEENNYPPPPPRFFSFPSKINTPLSVGGIQFRLLSRELRAFKFLYNSSLTSCLPEKTLLDS